MAAVVFDPRKDSRAQSQLAAQKRAVGQQQSQVRAMQAQVPGRATGGVSGQMGGSRGPSPTAKPTNRISAGTGGVKPANPAGSGRRYDSPAPSTASGSVENWGTRTEPNVPYLSPTKVQHGAPSAAHGISRQKAESMWKQMQNPVPGTGGIKPTREMAEAIAFYGFSGNATKSAGIMPPPSGSTPQFENTLDRWKQQNNLVGSPEPSWDGRSRGPESVRWLEWNSANNPKPGKPAFEDAKNPLAATRGPRSYMGMEDKKVFGARSTQDLERDRTKGMGTSGMTHDSRWRKATSQQQAAASMKEERAQAKI